MEKYDDDTIPRTTHWLHTTLVGYTDNFLSYTGLINDTYGTFTTQTLTPTRKTTLTKVLLTQAKENRFHTCVIQLLMRIFSKVYNSLHGMTYSLRC